MAPRQRKCTPRLITDVWITGRNQERMHGTYQSEDHENFAFNRVHGKKNCRQIANSELSGAQRSIDVHSCRQELLHRQRDQWAMYTTAFGSREMWTFLKRYRLSMHTYKYHKEVTIPSAFPMLFCSDTEESDGPGEILSSPVRSVCSCQNQLAHYGWDGIPYQYLRPRCRRFVWGSEEPPEAHPIPDIAEDGKLPKTWFWSSG